EIGPQQPLPVQFPEEPGQLDRVLRNERDVGVVEEVAGVLAQHERGGRLRADDEVAFAGQVGEDAQVALDDFAGGLDVAVRQRAVRLPSAALARMANTLPTRANPSVRASTRSDHSRPCSATLAALASSINFGTLTRAGHSTAHILQLMHRSATRRTASAESCR